LKKLVVSVFFPNCSLIKAKRREEKEYEKNPTRPEFAVERSSECQDKTPTPTPAGGEGTPGSHPKTIAQISE